MEADKSPAPITIIAANRHKGTNVPLDKTVVRNLPGGVLHPDTGLIAATANKTLLPIVPQRAKKPPANTFFILSPLHSVIQC